MAEQKNTSREALTNLRLWRASKGWRLEDLATASGLTKAALSHLETGQSRANPLTVFRLAKALGITRKQLLEQEPEEAVTPVQ